MRLRWLWTCYASLFVALLMAVRISSSDFALLAQIMQIAPGAARYGLGYDDSPGAWIAVTAQRDGTRVRGDGFRDWGVWIMTQVQPPAFEELCALDVPHVHYERSDTESDLAVVFNAKRAATSDTSALAVAVADQYVSPQGGICTLCSDQFQTRVFLTTDWQSFAIPLSRMRQKGWGLPARPAPDPDGLVEVGVGVEGGAAFDLTLRDLRVARVPTGPP
jgi:hypothetical protein